MQRKIADAMLKIESQQQRMYIRRVMWLDLEERVKKVFDSAEATLNTMNSPVRFFLVVNPMGPEVFRSRPVPSRVAITNSIYVHASSIHYSVIKTYGESAGEHVFDSGGQLWFSQSPTGGVSVFMSPFLSQLHSVKEKELWVGWYEEPLQLTEDELGRHLVSFSRYLAQTTMTAPPSLMGYLFRLRLLVADRRNRSKVMNFTIQLLSRFVIPLLGVVVGFLAIKA